MAFVDTSGTNFVDTTGTGNIDPAIMDAQTLGQDLNAGLINQDFNALNQQAFDPSQVGLDNSLQSLMNTTLSDPSLQAFGGNATGAAPSWNPQLAGQQAGQQGGLSTDGTNTEQPGGNQQTRNVNPQGTSFYQQLRDALSGAGRQLGNLGFSTPANAAPSTNTLTNADLGPQSNFANPMPANTLTGVGSGISPTQTSQTAGYPATSRSVSPTSSGTTRSVTPAATAQPSAVPTPQAQPASAEGTSPLPQSGVLTPDTSTAPDSISTAPKTVRTTPYTAPGTAPTPSPGTTSGTSPPRTGTDGGANTGTAPGSRSTPSLQQLSGMLQRMGLPPWLANVIAQAVGQRAGMQGGRMPGRMPFRGMPFPMMRGRGRGGRGFRGFPGGFPGRFPGRGMPPWMRGGRFPGGGFPSGGQQGQPGSWNDWQPGDDTEQDGQDGQQPGTPDFSRGGDPAEAETTSTFRPGEAEPGAVQFPDTRRIGPNDAPPASGTLQGPAVRFRSAIDPSVSNAGEIQPGQVDSPFASEAMGAPGTPDYTFQPGMRLGPQASTAPAYRGQPGVGPPNFMRGQFGGPGQNLTTVTTPGGHSVRVNRAAAPAFRGFLSELEAAGAPVQSLGGFANRRIAGSGQISQHAFGNAIDIDQSGRNQVTPAFRQWAQQNAGRLRQISYKYGMVSGGDWRNPDFGHFEWSPRAMPSAVTVAIRERPWDAY